MYYYDTAYYFMVIFIFTYNYLHKCEEATAVCLSELFRKAKWKTFSHQATVLRACVRMCVRVCVCVLVIACVDWRLSHCHSFL